MDAQYFPFYIILSSCVRSILFYQNEDHNVRQIRFHVCMDNHYRLRGILFRLGTPRISANTCKFFALILDV